MMRSLIGVVAFACGILFTGVANAQAPKIKFGDLKPKDFETKVYAIDSSANAVVLADIGSSFYEGNTNGDFSIVFKRHTRIHLLNRNAFDAATISIPLYAANSLEEKIESLEAATYSLEDGKVVATKLDRALLYKDKVSKRYTINKFTMPNLKEGCIIDITYKLVSPYSRDLRSWYFQGEYPVLWSQYQISIPSVYDFVIFRQGYHPYALNTADATQKTFFISTPGETGFERTESFSFTTAVVTNLWAMKDVPPLKIERFTTTLSNHIAKLDFQLSKIKYPNSPEKRIMNDWNVASAELLKEPRFGEDLTKNNGWLKDEVKKITGQATPTLESAKKLYTYLQDNMTCTSHDALFTSNPMRKTYQAKNGNVADVNLLLTAMLLATGIEAHPVVLSTRDNGKAYEMYPIIDQFNYVICKAEIEGKSYLLDASYGRLGFGRLSRDCYNGSGRVIDATPVLVQLDPDSLREEKVTSVFLYNDTTGSGLFGTYSSQCGYNESYDLRETIANKTAAEYFKELKTGYSFEVDIDGSSIDSLKKFEECVKVDYQFKFKTNDEDIIYLNPMFTEAIKENPFKAAERLYPVEMDNTISTIFILRMEIPKGYKVEEMPKSAKVNFNETEGKFEYLVGESNGYIQLRSVLRINKAVFLPEDYAGLRDFYAFIVNKHSEPIVLKKL